MCGELAADEDCWVIVISDDSVFDGFFGDNGDCIVVVCCEVIDWDRLDDLPVGWALIRVPVGWALIRVPVVPFLLRPIITIMSIFNHV